MEPKITSMKHILSVIFLVLHIQVFSQSEYVNPMIGTDGTGHTFPAATVPFGMVQVGPDTRIDGSWEGASGYYYPDNTIYGFSHTHLSGTGCSDYGDVMLMPYIGNVPKSWEKGFYKSTFSHQNEKASAGYYSVMLDRGQIKCEMSATTHGALHTYQVLGEGGLDTLRVVMDLSHRDQLLASEIKTKGTHAVFGYRTSKAWAENQQVFYYWEANRPINSVSFIKQEEIISCAIFSFAMKRGETLSIKVGISPVDAQGAENNVKSEIKDFNITNVKQLAVDAWNRELSKINITTDSYGDKINFYTALYHTMIQPNTFSDVDGRYRGRDGKIHSAEGKYYTVFSLWDTFRALHPLHTLINQKRTEEFVNTFLLQYQQGGRLPMWELWCNETNCMIGYHAVPVLADALSKGIRMNIPLALEAAVSNANYNERSVPLYARKGYLEIGDENESVAKTLEYAYDDWCVALLAQAAGEDATRDRFLERSTAWINMVDPETKLMRPRVNGGRLTPFDPHEVNNHYTEANAWQYSFFVPHDVYGLIDAVGGEKYFESLLDGLFTAPEKTTGREQVDLTGLIGQYAHGNEPSHHIAYLYNYVGKPEKAAKYIYHILKDLYQPTPGGLPGNEDCGQMSAWYIFSSLGFYPVTPGSNHYVIGYPIFKESSIKFENGNSFKIITEGNQAENFYLDRIELNGVPINRLWISYEEMVAGGELFLKYASTKGSIDFTQTEKFPTAFRPSVFSAAPEIKAPNEPFKNQIEIAIVPFSKNERVLYTMDGTDPKSNGKIYNMPFSTNEKLVVRAVSQAESGYFSAEATAYFIPFPHPERSVKLESTYNPQYSAGGADGLIDGIRGAENWRKGDWQGFQDKDFIAEVDLGKPTSVNHTEIGFMQDLGAWILLPTTVSVEYLDENHTQIHRSEKKITAQDKESKVFLFPVVFKEKLSGIKYIRVKATNYGKLPVWHPGAGEPAFIFTDEIIVE
jgi:predicted alpha-1,2-mannosidase